MESRSGILAHNFGRTVPRVLIFFAGASCIGIILAVLASLMMQFVIPLPPPRLVLIRDIPLPGALPDAYRTKTRPLAPGVAVLFDHFDFQALDSNTHLLFIAHTGPSPDRELQVNPRFNPSVDAKTDGNIVVFDTRHMKVVGLLNIPQVAGIVVAPDLEKVFAADSNDDVIYAIDERTFRAVPLRLHRNHAPDSVEYAALDPLISVS